MIDIDRQLIRSCWSHKKGSRKVRTNIFLDPFLCNFMRPITSHNDFSREKKPKSIMLDVQCTSIQKKP